MTLGYFMVYLNMQVKLFPTTPRKRFLIGFYFNPGAVHSHRHICSDQHPYCIIFMQLHFDASLSQGKKMAGALPAIPIFKEF